MFSSLPRHGSSPFVKSGNEPGVQEMEISQAGSSQHKQRLRVTNVIGHGPGIKLLNGLAAASTNGDAIYTYRCRLSLSTIHHGRIWTMLKFLTVIGPRRAGRTTPKLRVLQNYGIAGSVLTVAALYERRFFAESTK